MMTTKNVTNKFGRTEKLPILDSAAQIKRTNPAYIAVLCLSFPAVFLVARTNLGTATKPIASSPRPRRPIVFNDADYFSTLQQGVDPNIEEHARQLAQSNYDDDVCSKMMAYLPGPFAHHGHGSQLNTYILAAITATFMGVPMVLLEPPMDHNEYAGGSQFGCPPDTFLESQVENGEPSWQMKPDFPMGLSRLIEHPTWLSKGCSIPTCREMQNYNRLTALVRRYRGKESLPSISCKTPEGKTVKVILSGGYAPRIYYRENSSQFTKRADPQLKRWALNLGATEEEAKIFSSIRRPPEIWDYVAALMNKAGILRYQPWIARDVEQMIKSYNLPLDDGLDTIHVRRGDKLEIEARGEVINYWKNHGYPDEENLPTDYIPFAQYLERYDPNECKNNGVNIIERNVYVATDDPVVVKSEIAQMATSPGGNTIFLDRCHRLHFYFNPTDDTIFHIDDSEGDDSCFARYHRNILSMADLLILAKSNTFIGEFNSNWGRLVRTMRTIMNSDGVDSIKKDGLTRTIDTRVAWGRNQPRVPGT